MSTFTYRAASDAALYVRHFKKREGQPVMDMDAVAICTGVPAVELTRRAAAGAGPVFTADELDRGCARTDIVRVKLGREPSMFDTLREFGDESAAGGLLLGNVPSE